VQHGQTGWLVPAGNAGALGTALVEVFANSSRSAVVGAAARAFVLPRFGVDGYINSVVGLYDRLLTEHSSAGSGFTRLVRPH
ncbi:MAG TPA: hypothetical protein VLV86_09195, partial [Vicinamibacterales bacterium]|nr:hypothetical protein [Vicinamibacterales bacterium]